MVKERWYLTNQHTHLSTGSLNYLLELTGTDEGNTNLYIYFILTRISLHCLVKPENNTLSGIQTESFSILEQLRGSLGPHQAGQAVLPGHHGAVRDEAAQLCDDSGQDGKVGTPADI